MMKLGFVTLAIATLATGAFGARRQTRPHSTRGRKSLATRNTEAPWGGAVVEGHGWNYVTGTLTVPSVTGQSGDATASIWVGIDGNECGTAIIQTGITVFGDGSLESWTEWWQYNEIYYDEPIRFKAGDQLRMTVYATSTTSGNTTIENLSNGQSESHTFRSVDEYPLCETDAEWIIEDYTNGGNRVPFVDFGSFHFTDAIARSSNGGGDVTPEGARIYNVEIDGDYKTKCSSDAEGVTCSYV